MPANPVAAPVETPAKPAVQPAPARPAPVRVPAPAPLPPPVPSTQPTRPVPSTCPLGAGRTSGYGTPYFRAITPSSPASWLASPRFHCPGTDGVSAEDVVSAAIRSFFRVDQVPAGMAG